MVAAAPPMRLNKFVALALGVSRRQADEMIAAGRVEQSGETVKVDGQIVQAKPYLYLALNKPVGYVSSRRAQTSAPTIYALIPEKLHHLKPVGRLDKDSSGLILLTNDGDFAERMTHPKYAKSKLYEVELDRDLEPLHQQMIADFGIMLTDGLSRFELAPASSAGGAGLAFAPGRVATRAALRLYGPHPRRSWLVVLKEGRNRQIRRTFGALGYTVTRLHRTQFGPYQLDGLAPGAYVGIRPVKTI